MMSKFPDQALAVPVKQSAVSRALCGARTPSPITHGRGWSAMHPLESLMGVPYLRITIDIDATFQIVGQRVEKISPGHPPNGHVAAAPPPPPPPLRRVMGESLRAAAGSDDMAGESAWVRLIDQLTGDEDLHPSFAGQSPRDIFRMPGVAQEVRLLASAGVINSLELVLRRGVKRCSEVRRWVEKKRQSQRIENAACLMASVILADHPGKKQ